MFNKKMKCEEEKLKEKFGPILNCGCGQKGWGLPVSKFLLNLRKYRLLKHKRCAGCVLPSGTLEEHIHIVIRTLPERAGWALLNQYIDVKTRWPEACRHGVNQLFRKRTGLLKMGGRKISPYWREMCYWEIGYGFVEYVEIDKMTQEVRRWLCDENVLVGPLWEDAYMDMLFTEVQNFMSTEFKTPHKIPTVKEWVMTGKWMEGKAGTGGNVAVTIDGKRKLSVRTKPAEGVLISDSDVEMDLKTLGRERMVVLEKSEPGKIRSVVKTGNAVNRKMNYLSTILEDGLHGSRLSTLFAGEGGNEDIDMDLIIAVRDENLWKVPLD